MSRPVRFEPEAAAELADAALWYDQQHAGLGARFLGAVDATLARIDGWPETAPQVEGLAAGFVVRRASVHQFPYRLAYLIHDGTIRVLAVAHVRRAPGYWHARAETPGTEFGPPSQ